MTEEKQKKDKLPFLLTFETRKAELESILKHPETWTSQLPHKFIERVLDCTVRVAIQPYSLKIFQSLSEDEFELTVLQATSIIIKMREEKGIQIPLDKAFLIERWKVLPDWMKTYMVGLIFWTKPPQGQIEPVTVDDVGTVHSYVSGRMIIRGIKPPDSGNSKVRFIIGFKSVITYAWEWSPDGFMEIMEEENPDMEFYYQELPC